MSGLALIVAGAWVRLKLHRYLLLDGEASGGGHHWLGDLDLASTVLPSALCGLGLAVLAVASVACHCAVRGAAFKLYAVRLKRNTKQ